MLSKSQIHFRKSLTVWCFVLIVLASSVCVEAAKAQRRGGQKTKTNYDAMKLSYGGRNTGATQQHQTKQVYPQRASPPVASAPSAPPLPTNNKPIGWNIPASNTPVQQKTVSNTNTGYPAPASNPGYPVQSHAPPAYNTYSQYPQHPPQQNFGAPPAYNQPGSGLNPHSNSGPPPAYSAPIGVNTNVGYPQQGGYNPPTGIYHSQGVQNPSYPVQQPSGYIPNGQQTPIVNNYYGSQPTQSGSGSSIAKNALLLGAGGLAGAAIYGALTPGQETKTVIIHDTVPSQPPNVSPAAAAPTVVQASESNVPLAQAPNVPLAQAPNVPLAQAPNVPLAQAPNVPLAQAPNVPLAQAPNVPLAQAPNIPPAHLSTDVPLAPMPETTIAQSTVPNMPGLDTTIATEPIVPIAPLPDSNITLPKLTEQRSNNNNTMNTELSVSTAVPLAPFPAQANPSSQVQLKGDANHLTAFNISVYAAMSMILAKLLI